MVIMTKERALELLNISFKLLNYWVAEGDRTVIAEWYVEFTDTKRSLKIEMTEVAIFEVNGDKFGALREYYKSVELPL